MFSKLPDFSQEIRRSSIHSKIFSGLLQYGRSVRKGGSFQESFIFTNKEVTNTRIAGAILNLLREDIIFIYNELM
jgi:hypothetical protein